MRFRQPDGYTPPAELIQFARKAMGELLEYAQPMGLQVVKREHHLNDGSIVEVSFDGTTPIATIHPAPPAEPTGSQPPVNFWMPRGFVVLPAWGDAPFGIGLPVVPDAGGGPYDPINTAPGMAKERWTVGGVCGEVLLSPDLRAGYPVSPVVVTVPLLFHPTRGPVMHWQGKGMLDAREPDGAWLPYRIELEPPAQHYADESPATMVALFEAINDARTTALKPALNLPPRGYYHPGQVMCSIMQAAGTTDATSASYPPTYLTPHDRLTKDGYAALMEDRAFTGWDRTDGLLGAELRAAGSVASAMATWGGDPGDAAALVADYQLGATLDAGERGGFLCASIESRDRWIQAGNQSWQSSDPALPPLSWFGFASLNLAWETNPARYDPDSTTQPIIPRVAFTTANGDCWMTYPRSATDDPALKEPAMSRHVFARGRAIALAPRGGLVWAAALANVALETGSVDRLIALVHHAEDQGSAVSGQVRYLRVWWCDIPPRGQLRADPQSVICGEDLADPWGWRGGELFDLGVMPDPPSGFVASAGVNSLKYASQWRFAPDGSRAVCLRDYGAQADYQSDAIGNLEALFTNHSRTVELVFGLLSDELVTNVTFHGYTPSQDAAPLLLPDDKPPLTTDELVAIGGGTAALYDAGAYPVAVDYDDQNFLIYAFQVTLFTSAFIGEETGFARQLSYQYLGIGSASAGRLSDLTGRALCGVSFKTPSQDMELTVAAVIDVRQAAFTASGMRPRFAADIAHLPGDASVQPADPTGVACNYFTAAPVNGVRLFHNGALVDERWYGNPDGALWWPVARCSKTGDSLQVSLPPAISANVQGYYAARFGQFVLSYQVAPVPNAVLVLPEEPADDDCDCHLTQAELAGGISLHWLSSSELAPRGGAASASVNLPPADWLIYSKVV